ncbi:MAG TPA: hypothetical protein VFW84_15095 [Aquabacterium sp.]|nr:hypothetical protein [Aquabacterium sp.]HEX5374052.1 hypothetical protein [Aquabacterium sp.]
MKLQMDHPDEQALAERLPDRERPAKPLRDRHGIDVRPTLP